MPFTFFSDVLYHIVWQTRAGEPLLTLQNEVLAQRSLRRQLAETPGAVLHEIGGTENHVHMVVSLPPDLLLSEFIGRLKGGSAHEVNLLNGRGRKVLEWQPGFGVVTFGPKDLDWLCQYVRQQREHHERGTLHARLERTSPLEDFVAFA